MRIGVLSDTHGDYLGTVEALRIMGNIDLLLHAGDMYKDAMRLKEEFNIYVIAVRGNMDFTINKPSETFIEIAGKRIFLTHGHTYGVKSGIQRLYYKALEEDANIVVFGHSHIPLYLREEDIIFLNPGSIARPRGGSKPSFALMEIDNDNVDVKFIELK